ncbi:phage tail protein [Haliangium sp.]|uniref:phage tail protein n=1 Tax=Haliangium sp. TaxID=2663208 RepID=UPI003D0EB781
MSCIPAPPTFRLLDALVGWDTAPDDGLVGLAGEYDPAGLTLVEPPPQALSPAAVLPWLSHPRVARGCDPGVWYLAARAGAAPLLRHDPCAPRASATCLAPFWRGVDPATTELVATAVAVWRRRVAVADRDAGRVWILHEATCQVLADIAVAAPRVLAFTPDGELLVVTGAGALHRYGPDGSLRSQAHRPPPGGEILRLAVDAERAVWALIQAQSQTLLMRAPAPGADRNGGDGGDPWLPSDLTSLAARVRPGVVTRTSEDGFAVRDPDCHPDDGSEATLGLWGWNGCARADLPLPAPAPPPPRRGQLLTVAIDSGIHRCAWHRVRADADVPVGTSLAVAVAAAEELPASTPSGVEGSGPWQGFPLGVPHPLDWQEATASAGAALDFLVDQPRGRYLYLRVRMSSDSLATPRLRRLRLDMPRVTSAVHLPAVYGDDPDAADFGDRFLSVFDATVASFDEAIERMPELLDVAHTPAEVLPWLARFFDIELDAGWSEDQRRAIIAAAPALYRLRGTPEGLRRAIELVLGLPVAASPADATDGRPFIRELSLERPWGGLGRSTQLGAVRLFGRARARFRLGSSGLGASPLHSRGDPAADPIEVVAHRFEVLVPPQPGTSPERLRQVLERLVETQSPTHTLGSVRVGGSGWQVGVTAMVGIDTVSVAPRPAVLASGQGSIRLGRRGVLASGARGPTPGFRVGSSSAVGIHSALE